MTLVLPRSSIDVVNEEISTVSHLDVDGPLATVSEVGEAGLSCDLSLSNCGMSAV